MSLNTSNPSSWPAAFLVAPYMPSSCIIILILFLLFTSKSHSLKYITKRIHSWKYLLSGRNIIQLKYESSKGKPFEILAPDNRYVFVSSPSHIRELHRAPDNVLSLQGASKQMLQPVYTMHGFNWCDVRGAEGLGFVRTLRTLLTNNLPKILPNLSRLIRTRFIELHQTHHIVNGSRHTPIYPSIMELVVHANAVAFFGEELAKDEAIIKAGLAYIKETLVYAEIIKLVPQLLAPVVGGIIKRRLKSQDILYNALIQVASQRCSERDLARLGHQAPKHADCIQWIMETSPRQNPWSPQRIVLELMAIWYGSVHALSTTITFAVQDLCLHPEHVEPLQRELECQYERFECTAQGLLLLDSFIKESARLTPVEAMSTRRSALQPFKLSDGTELKVGDWACTPVKAIMQSSEFYPQPLQFSGFRFADPKIVDQVAIEGRSIQPKPSKLTDVSSTWHVWGGGRMACPGRYYAVAVMKVIIGQLLMHYNCELVDADASRWFTWRSTMLPKENTMVILTPRS